MSELPAYYAWYPALNKKRDTVSIILTPGQHERPPAGRSFFEAVLDAAGVQAELLTGGVHSFLSSYFSGKSWQECWDAKLLLADSVSSKPESTIEGAGVFVDPDSYEKPEQTITVCVLADFARRRDADDCRTELKAQAAKAKWNEIHYSRYTLRDVGARHKQLVVDVATRERDRPDRLEEAFEAAEQVIATCERYGGSTHPGSSAE